MHRDGSLLSASALLLKVVCLYAVLVTCVPSSTQVHVRPHRLRSRSSRTRAVRYYFVGHFSLTHSSKQLSVSIVLWLHPLQHLRVLRHSPQTDDAHVWRALAGGDGCH